jgi:hypothetical protein
MGECCPGVWLLGLGWQVQHAVACRAYSDMLAPRSAALNGIPRLDLGTSVHGCSAAANTCAMCVLQATTGLGGPGLWLVQPLSWRWNRGSLPCAWMLYPILPYNVQQSRAAAACTCLHVEQQRPCVVGLGGCRLGVRLRLRTKHPASSNNL